MVPSPDGVSSALHDKVLDVSSPGVVQVRVLPSPDGVSSALHDKVLDVSSPGEVQIRPVPSALGDPSSPSSHDTVLVVARLEKYK